MTSARAAAAGSSAPATATAAAIARARCARCMTPPKVPMPVPVLDMLVATPLFDLPPPSADARRRKLPAELAHLAEHALDHVVRRLADDPVHPGGDLPRLGLLHAAAGDRRRSQPDA